MKKYLILTLVSVLLLSCNREEKLTVPSGVSVLEAEVSAGEPYHISGSGFESGDLIAFESKDSRYRFQSVIKPGTLSSSGVDVILPKGFVYEMEYYVYLVRVLERVLLGSAMFHKGAVSLEEGMDFCGLVSDIDGNPIPGVTVSDGYSCAVTDEKGVYQLKGCEYSYHVNISVPSGYKIPLKDDQVCFWETIEQDRTRYDFVLEPLAQPEKEFYLFCLADPQCQNQNRHVMRFRTETVPDIRQTLSALPAGIPCYGITLGDVGYNNADTDYNSKNGIFPAMKEEMTLTKIGMPLFQVMGNHDNRRIDPGTYSVASDISAESAFKKAFGPVNYSFDRGDVHIVAMDNILFTNHNKYSLGFRDDQVEWLRQDLANVPKDKMVILCVHIPLGGTSSNNVKEVVEQIESFGGCHIMAGHTHYSANAVYAKRYEHIHAAICGAWWRSTVNTDGAPNGYAYYKVNGPTIESWLYKGVDLNASCQIRMYRGNLDYLQGGSETFRFQIDSDDCIWANIWNWDTSWTVEVYEDGVFSGNMTLSTSGTRRDAWAVGYHVGFLGLTASGYNKTSVSHLFYYKLKNPSAKVEIRATDRFGNRYVQNTFTGNTREFWPVAPPDEGSY